MVHKVLSIIASILFGLMTLVFAVCLVFTLASPAVQAGFDSVSNAIDNAVEQATRAMDTSWDFDFGALFGGVGSAADGPGPDAQGAGSSGGSGWPWGGSAAGGSNLQAGDFADPVQGQAYLAWRQAVADPVGQIFAGTGVTAAMLEGVAGGSVSARDVLASLDEAALQAVSSSAASYAATVAATSVPASLDDAVRAQLWEANSAAQSFAASVQTVVGAIRSVKAGGWGSLDDLMSAANTAVANLQTLEACMAQAEALLGAA